MNSQALIGCIAVVAAALFAAQGHAAFVSPEAWARGDDYSMYVEWDRFDSATVATSPDVGNINTAGTELRELAGASFLTSAGNIYSFAAAQSFLLTIAGDDNAPSILTDSVDVRLQVRTLGTSLDTNSVRLNGVTAGVSLLGRETAAGGFGGVIEEYLFTWSILPTNFYVVEFAAEESSLSLDALAFDAFGAPGAAGIGIPPLPALPPFPWPPADTGGGPSTVVVSAVPIPSGFVLFGSALLTLLWRRRPAR